MEETKLEDVTVFNDICERLKRITPENIEAAGRKLAQVDTPEDLTAPVIGQVQSMTTRALYCLWRQLVSETKLQEAMAESADEELIEQDHLKNAAVANMFADVARSLFWAQAKIDLDFRERASVSIKSDWVIVRLKHSGPQMQMMRIPMPFGDDD